MFKRLKTNWYNRGYQDGRKAGLLEGKKIGEDRLFQHVKELRDAINEVVRARSNSMLKEIK